MTIDRLGGIDPLNNYGKTEKTTKTSKPEARDTIELSAEARDRAELFMATEAVRSTPDIRMDRVEELRRKLEDPNYINDTLLEGLADRLLDSFGV